MDLRTVLENSISHMKGFEALKKIHSEASTRGFFRIFLKDRSLVAMVYPKESKDEIQRIIQNSRENI